MTIAKYHIKKETRRTFQWGHWSNETVYTIYKGNTAHGTWTTRQQATKAMNKLKKK